MRTNFFSVIFLFILCFQVHSKEWVIFPSNDAQDEIQTAMILAKPGDTIYLKSGTYNLNHGLSLDVDNILLKVDVLDRTVLNFK